MKKLSMISQALSGNFRITFDIILISMCWPVSFYPIDFASVGVTWKMICPTINYRHVWICVHNGFI